LASQEADAKAAITRLSRLRQEQKKIAKTLRHEQSSTGSSLASLRKEHQQLEALLAAWKSRQSTSQPFAQYKGKLNWPVKGKLSAFEDPSSNNGRKGVFIAAKAGTAVKAVHGGQIIFSDWLRGFGMMCIIDHGNGYLSLYGQNDSLTHQAGKYVQSGDQIGTVGRSGGQTTSGVYFELRHNGKPTNAQHWLARSTP
ncbi:MAG: peptidoglycan DD-metalloendopeptidase family protein, partial [Gammaproteobacteria bacterium]